MKHAKTLALAVAGTAITALAVVGVSYAETKYFSGQNKDRDGSKFTSEQRAAAETAIASNDYNAWKTAMGGNPMTEKITADNFTKFVEAHNLMKEGKTDEAKTIMEELGVNGIGFGPIGCGGHAGWRSGTNGTTAQ